MEYQDGKTDFSATDMIQHFKKCVNYSCVNLMSILFGNNDVELHVTFTNHPNKSVNFY